MLSSVRPITQPSTNPSNNSKLRRLTSARAAERKMKTTTVLNILHTHVQVFQLNATGISRTFLRFERYYGLKLIPPASRVSFSKNWKRRTIEFSPKKQQVWCQNNHGTCTSCVSAQTRKRMRHTSQLLSQADIGFSSEDEIVPVLLRSGHPAPFHKQSIAVPSETVHKESGSTAASVH